ncbi:putative Non-specific lipid-transfer protein [Cocos nucifera]|nr:putative Non-specific lipid-transfer protein [Cocos nucifera]
MEMIAPCMAYLSDQALVPSGRCCEGVVALNRTVSTRGDRVAICNCLKSVAPNFPGVDFSRVAALPRLCGVHINTTISPSIDCDSLPPAELEEVQH